MIDSRPILTRLADGLPSSLAFLAWAAAMIWLLVSGTYVTFRAPSLWGLLVVAIVTTLALAAARVLRPADAVSHSHDHDDPDEDDETDEADCPQAGCCVDSHSGKIEGVALKNAILLLPLLFLFAMPSPQAGSYAFDNRAGLGSGKWNVNLLADELAPARPGAGNPSDPAPATSPDPDVWTGRAAVPVEGTDLAVSHVPSTPATLLEIYNGYDGLARKRVTTIGMVNPRAGLPPDTIILFRFTLVCCAADARPVWILATCKGARSLKRDTWVEIEGDLGRSQVNGQIIPWINGDQVRPIHRPLDAYLN